MHVIERQARISERVLPGRPFVAGIALHLDALDYLGEARLGTKKLHTAGVALIAPQPLLQRPLDRPLQG